MPDVDGVLFIDANIYLGLYETASGKKLLRPLREQQRHVFVTEQVVQEVQRRKVEVVARFLARQFEALKLRPLAVPDHLFGVTNDRAKQVGAELKEIHARIQAANDGLGELAQSILDEVSRSSDEVSQALGAIFAHSVPHTADELRRAAERRKLGRPPGKKGGPLGDELSWEQVLSRCRDKARLWVITRDSDYATESRGRLFLNAALYEDLAKVRRPTPEAYCYNDVVDGIRHFAATMHIRAEALPTPEEAKQIKEEQQDLDRAEPTLFGALRAILGPEAGNQLRQAGRLYSSDSSLAAILRGPVTTRRRPVPKPDSKSKEPPKGK